MSGPGWTLLIDPSTPVLILLAGFTILYGAVRSAAFYAEFKESLELEQSSVKMWTAIIMPIVGSVFLVLLFYFLDKIVWLLFIIFTCTSTVGATFVAYPFVERIVAKLGVERVWSLRWIGDINLSGILSFFVALSVVIPWLVFRWFLLTDILAFCLALSGLAFVRLPNLKISTLILVLFFLYDIFWVFLSEFIFKSNVMVSVAKNLPSLPMVILIPRVLYPGYSLLGVGDIVLPGLFLCFLYRFDLTRRNTFKEGYFLRAWIGYFLGLMLTLVMVVALDRGQPALLYLVPFTLIPTYAFGIYRKELRLLWNGPESESKKTDLESGSTEYTESLIPSESDG
eukprot:TRINITY_DN6232_c0_g1_i1.p1 TRINITY_DN6232_c0_g1~~TRINITY_DN6232_c0_g1_i1.p1  ORF type:complete len:349 (-),score=67.30 TRINITY_DN6232_c0_g1_i1:35-1054(-)